MEHQKQLKKILDDCAQQMSALGFHLHGENIETSNEFVNVEDPIGKPGNNSLWYVAKTGTARNGQSYLLTSYGNFRTGQRRTYRSWGSGDGDYSQDEVNRLEKEVAEQLKESDQARNQKQKEAAERASKEWESLSKEGDHSYLNRKEVGAFGVRFGEDRIGNFVAIPVRGIDGKLRGLQKIYDCDIPKTNRNKTFTAGMKKEGGLHLIGHINPHGPVYFAEGFATAASIHQATHGHVIVAFDAGNIDPVLKSFREKYPLQTFVICADNDAYTIKPDGTPWNPGVRKAVDAAWAYNALLAISSFKNVNEKPTDFNDLHLREGVEEVKNQVETPKTPEDWLVEAAQNDPGAPFEKDILERLRELKSKDLPRYIRLRERLKTVRGIVTELEIQLKARGTSSEKKGVASQSAAARVIANNFKNRIAWGKQSDRWVQYFDGIWKETLKNDIPEKVYKFIKNNGAIFEGEFSSHFFRGVMDLLGYELPFHAKQNKSVLPLKNGVLDLTSKELLGHKPSYSFTWQLPYNYDADADCGPIKTWLTETVGDTHTVQLLRAYLNATVLGQTDLQIFLELVGPGGTGKTTFLWLAVQLVGEENTVTTELKYLENNRFETANLYNKRLVLITDAERYAGEISVLKALTGSDPLRFEEKFKQGRNQFYPEAMVIIAANETIQSREYTSGLRRRRITTYFKNPVPIEKQRNLQSEFSPFLPGLLNWILTMPEDEVKKVLKERGGTSQLADEKQSLLDTNPIGLWLDIKVVFDPDQKTYVGHAKRLKDEHDFVIFKKENEWLYPNYKKFCEMTGNRAVSMRRFSSLLEDLCRNQLGIDEIVLNEKDSRGRSFTGLRIRKDEDEGKRSPVDLRFSPKMSRDRIVCDESVTGETPVSDGNDGCDYLYKVYIQQVKASSYMFPFFYIYKEKAHPKPSYPSHPLSNQLLNPLYHPSLLLPDPSRHDDGDLICKTQIKTEQGVKEMNYQTKRKKHNSGLCDNGDVAITAREILNAEGIAIRYIAEPEQVEGAIEDLTKAKVLGLDIETAKLEEYSDHKNAGLDPHLSHIRLVQICNNKTAYVFDMNSIKLQSFAALFDCPLVAHNSLFEMKHLIHAGLELENINCTMLMANALDGNLPNLADLAQTRLGWEISKELQTSDWSAKILSPDQVAYAALDAVAALRLYMVLHEELNNKNVLNVYDLMLRAIKAIAQLELNGIYFNLEAHKGLIIRWGKEKEAAEEDLRQLFGPDLNPASGAQISSWLKENLGEETLRRWPRTEKTGQLKTGASVLCDFSEQPLVKPLLKYKEVSKLFSTYGTKYAAHVNPVTGRINASFRLGGTKTGRLSCNSPNIQNPPRNKDFRALFCAPPGKALLVADYSQIELRVAALVSEDEVMMEAYENGLDLHKKTAAEISGVPFDEVTKEQRQAAKAINFGLLYGQGARGLAKYARANYGVNMSVQEARKAKTAFFRTYRGLARWQKRTGNLSKRENRITTPEGRVRDFGKEQNGYRYTEALNTPIQGGAAEVLLATLGALEKHLKNVDAKLVNVVHDEFVLEVALEDSNEAVIALEAAMIEGMLTIFPNASTTNLVEANDGPNWAEAK